MTDSIEIKRVLPQDVDILRKISIETFEEAFAKDNTNENMQLYLDEAFSRTKLTAELDEPFSVFYFSFSGELITGYIKINTGPAQTDLKDKPALEIERVYVRKEFQRRKVGQSLLEKALAVAREKSVEFVWLGVWEKNEPAIRFYRKNGFEPFGQHIFMLGNDEQIDILMKLPLRNNG